MFFFFIPFPCLSNWLMISNEYKSTIHLSPRGYWHHWEILCRSSVLVNSQLSEYRERNHCWDLSSVTWKWVIVSSATSTPLHKIRSQQLLEPQRSTTMCRHIARVYLIFCVTGEEAPSASPVSCLMLAWQATSVEHVICTLSSMQSAPAGFPTSCVFFCNVARENVSRVIVDGS